MGPTSVGPSAAAAEGRRAAPPREPLVRLEARLLWHLAPTGCCCGTALSGGALTGPQACEAAPHARWRRAPNRRSEAPFWLWLRSGPSEHALGWMTVPQARPHRSPCRCAAGLPAGSIDRVAPTTHRIEVDSLQQPYPGTLSRPNTAETGRRLPVRQSPIAGDPGGVRGCPP